MARRKHTFLVIWFFVAILLAVVFWPRESIPLDFLKTFRRGQSFEGEIKRSTLYHSERDFDAFCREAAKELAARGWRNDFTHRFRTEDWAFRNEAWLTIYEGVAYYHDDGRTRGGGVTYKRGQVSVEISYKKSPLWQDLLKMFGR